MKYESHDSWVEMEHHFVRGMEAQRLIEWPASLTGKEPYHPDAACLQPNQNMLTEPFSVSASSIARTSVHVSNESK